MNKKQENELATKPEEETALVTTEQLDGMFGGSGYQIPIGAPLPQILILRETPKFETPEGETLKEVIGHIIYWHHANQYYPEEFGEGEAGPPTCASLDGVKPFCDGDMVQQNDYCCTCPMNQYGTAREGKGKACQNTIRLYVLVSNEVIPCLIKASPASLNKKDSLMKWLTNAPNIAVKAGAGTHYQVIEVKFTLHTKDFETGFKASVLDLETVRVLDPRSDALKLEKLGKLYGDFMNSYMPRIKGDVASEHLANASAEDDVPFSDESGGDDNTPI